MDYDLLVVSGLGTEVPTSPPTGAWMTVHLSWSTSYNLAHMRLHMQGLGGMIRQIDE